MFRNKMFNIGLLVIIAITLFGIVGFVGYKTVIAPTAAENQAEVELPDAKEMLASQFEIGKMTANLQGDALIQATFSIQGESEDVKNELEVRKAQIKDIINITLHQITEADVAKSDGLDGLKQRLTEAMNKVMQEGKVTDVYITDIVIQ